MKRKLIKCNDIQYRKGFIEVEPNIHPNLINIEVWNIHPSTDIEKSLNLDELSDGAVTGRVEVELNLIQAEELVSRLQTAIKRINKSVDNL